MKLSASDSGSKSQKFRKVGGPWGCLKQEDFPVWRVTFHVHLPDVQCFTHVVCQLTPKSENLTQKNCSSKQNLRAASLKCSPCEWGFNMSFGEHGSWCINFQRARNLKPLPEKRSSKVWISVDITVFLFLSLCWMLLWTIYLSLVR